jgi:2-polyprenyl-6-methoxyphenol hydroxylase-like FAD-dependent oxidoreductase
MGAEMSGDYSSRHAVVLGGSLAGLLAARVLSEYFDTVTLVERDVLPEGPEDRKGVPQGRHAHAVLARGFQAFKRLFPDLEAGLIEGGAVMFDLGSETRWWHYDGYKVRYESGLIGPSMSRAFLEGHVRRRVRALPNVVVRDATNVNGLITSPSRERVIGAAIQPRLAGAPEEALVADLVVDATGRGSRAPQWLAGFGFERPEEATITINAVYTTRLFRRRPGEIAEAKMLYCLPTPPLGKRMGGAFPIEGDRWIVSLGGWHNAYAPADEAGFVDFARSLPTPDIHHVVQRAEPVSDFAVHRFPANLRRRYEALGRVPDGFIVIGDAMCSFNPLFGQGMTVAAMEAEVLDKCLAEARWRNTWQNFPHRFFKLAAKAIDTPWTLAAGEDFRYPETIGTKAPATDLINRYTARVHRAVHHDPVVCHAFYEAMNLLRPPTSLFRPAIVWRVLRATWRKRPTGQKTAGRRETGRVERSAVGTP